MNKKRKVDDVLESIFNLIQDAYKELKESEKNDQNHNNLLIGKEKSINIHKSLIKEKITSNSKSRDGDWSNLNFTINSNWSLDYIMHTKNPRLRGVNNWS